MYWINSCRENALHCIYILNAWRHMDFSLSCYFNNNPVSSIDSCFYCVPKPVQCFQCKSKLNTVFFIALMLSKTRNVSLRDKHLFLGTCLLWCLCEQMWVEQKHHNNIHCYILSITSLYSFLDLNTKAQCFLREVTHVFTHFTNGWHKMARITYTHRCVHYIEWVLHDRCFKRHFNTDVNIKGTAQRKRNHFIACVQGIPVQHVFTQNASLILQYFSVLSRLARARFYLKMEL